MRNKAVAFAVSKIGRPYAVDFEVGAGRVFGVMNHKGMVRCNQARIDGRHGHG